MTDTRGPAPQWVRDRHTRLSSTPFGVLGAGWVLYSVGVLGAVYGFLFLPPRGWAMLHVLAALVLALGALIGVSELLSRRARTKLDQELADLPFPVTGYPEALGAMDVDEARLELSFAQAPAASAVQALVSEASAPWLSCDAAGDTITLAICDALGEGTNWRLSQRLRFALTQVCLPTHTETPLSAVAISASASSARTSASDE